ncbi:hypothetical protein Dfer_3209 [Dyadobacter fermentans DSM 18053]|uniref:Uncharacterized protein n=1 Tax=Dyadobacter fermentans (strain ATCC 700827 / DSM 18053 / CIP 107007 / KCTC 52180 / NS114) TaxID=471854 RepID=C6W7E4_DYAFD|nr:hypothetical protein Dfer_3209 [Dyadobacter fermentans DSM 18053]
MKIWFVMNRVNITKHRSAKNGIERPESVIQQTASESNAM